MKTFYKNKRLTFVLRIIPLIVIAVFLVLFFIYRDKITVDAIISYTPARPFAAAIFLIFLYAVKSLSVFMPIVLLQIAAGTLFPPFSAVLVNITGCAVCFTVPYCLGYFAESGAAEHIIEKYPKIKKFTNMQQENDLFISFFLRILNCLPIDIVSLYLGSIKIPYIKYISGSMLGAFTGILAATVIGVSITDTSAALFAGAVIINLIISILSFLIYKKYKHNKKS